MWLRLDLEGLDFQFRITGYHPSTQANWDWEWCHVDLSMIAPHWLDYHIDNGEIMLCCEVESLKSEIEELLANKIMEAECLSFMEPDLSFSALPSKDLRDNPDYVYIEPGYEFTDACMELEVNTWSHGLTSNRIITCFDREELEVFLCYLKLICGEVNAEDEAVQRYMSEGKIYDPRPET